MSWVAYYAGLELRGGKRYACFVLALHARRRGRRWVQFQGGTP